MKELEANNIKKFEEKIASSSTFTLSAHTNPDGDAVGSTIGLMNYLLSLGKDVMVIYPDEINDTLKFIINEECENRVIIYSKETEKAEERLNNTDVIIFLDANSFKRTSHLEQALTNAKSYKILIDHHLNPETELFNLYFSETNISSTCEFLYYILMELKDIDKDASKLPPMTGRALMTGMTTDTNNFANSVFPTTFNMASSLLAAGVDRDYILNQLYNQYREERLRLMGTFLKDLLTITEDGVAYAIISKKTQNAFKMKIGETEGFVNMPLAIKNVRMSIFLKEDDTFYRVSVRSKKGTSANRIAMEYFNGGGHENAAGGRLYFGKDIEGKDNAVEYIEKVTKEFFNKD